MFVQQTHVHVQHATPPDRLAGESRQGLCDAETSRPGSEPHAKGIDLRVDAVTILPAMKTFRFGRVLPDRYVEFTVTRGTD